MATNWAEVVKAAVPAATAFVGVAGVWVGSRLNARSQREAFLRERTFGEMTRRREVGTRFKKSLWVFSRRVEVMRDMAVTAAKLKAQGQDYSELKFDLSGARDLQLKMLDDFADLEGFATTSVQVAARSCYEALVASFNAASGMNVTEAQAKFAYFQQQYQLLMTELNSEGQHFNAVIDATFTPFRRLLLRRVLRQPEPYRVTEIPSDLVRPGEGVHFERPKSE